jgi:hypothetical protein
MTRVFEIGSFENLRKPTHLRLNYTSITYLDENIFLPFLHSNDKNLITFESDDKLNCDDWRNYWLRKDFYLLGNRTNISECTNGKSALMVKVFSVIITLLNVNKIITIFSTLKKFWTLLKRNKT